jgi:hypothetical protein
MCATHRIHAHTLARARGGAARPPLFGPALERECERAGDGESGGQCRRTGKRFIACAPLRCAQRRCAVLCRVNGRKRENCRTQWKRNRKGYGSAGRAHAHEHTQSLSLSISLFLTFERTANRTGKCATEPVGVRGSPVPNNRYVTIRYIQRGGRSQIGRTVRTLSAAQRSAAGTAQTDARVLSVTAVPPPPRPGRAQPMRSARAQRTA